MRVTRKQNLQQRQSDYPTDACKSQQKPQMRAQIWWWHKNGCIIHTRQSSKDEGINTQGNARNGRDRLNTKREFNSHVNVTSCLLLVIILDEEIRDLPILTTFENCTAFSAAFCRSSMEKILRPASLINFCAASMFVPCNLAIMGMLRFMLSTTLMRP